MANVNELEMHVFRPSKMNVQPKFIVNILRKRLCVIPTMNQKLKLHKVATRLTGMDF